MNIEQLADNITRSLTTAADSAVADRLVLMKDAKGMLDPHKNLGELYKKSIHNTVKQEIELWCKSISNDKLRNDVTFIREVLKNLNSKMVSDNQVGIDMLQDFYNELCQSVRDSKPTAANDNQSDLKLPLDKET